MLIADQETIETQKPNDLDRLAVGRSLGIQDIQDMERHQNRLDRIIEWAQAKGAKNQSEYVAELAHLRNTIGSPTIFDLTVYLNLEMEHMATEKAKTELEAKSQAVSSQLKKFQKTQRNDKGQYT